MLQGASIADACAAERQLAAASHPPRYIIDHAVCAPVSMSCSHPGNLRAALFEASSTCFPGALNARRANVTKKKGQLGTRRVRRWLRPYLVTECDSSYYFSGVAQLLGPECAAPLRYRMYGGGANVVRMPSG